MKTIILQRTIAVRCWHVIGQVAKASKRTELMPVLERARERGQTSADDVAEHLLFEPRSRRVVAQRLLHIAARYGLLKQNDRWFDLTAAGAAALESGHVFVPEHGTWTIWASNDPLLGYPVLRIDAWNEPTAFDELRGKEKEKDDRKPVDIPRTLRESVGRVATPSAGSGAPLRIDELADKGEDVDPDASLRLIWDVMEKRMRLEGAIAGARVNTALEAPSVPASSVWRQLLESEGLWPRWDDAATALRVGFGETTDRERESMRRDLYIERPTLADCGDFDAVTIRDVALRADTTQDASLWAAWRLRTRVREYATAERYGMWSSEAITPFAEYRPPTPTRQALAAEAWRTRGARPTPTAWHLVAAEDWGL